MSEPIQLEDGTCCRYTPDAGTVEGPVKCGVCGDVMNERRGCHGPTGFAEAMGKGGHAHDVFTCPHSDEPWHYQVVHIRNYARKIPSKTICDLLEAEIETILETRKPTKDVGKHFWC